MFDLVGPEPSRDHRQASRPKNNPGGGQDVSQPGGLKFVTFGTEHDDLADYARREQQRRRALVHAQHQSTAIPVSLTGHPSAKRTIPYYRRHSQCQYPT